MMRKLPLCFRQRLEWEWYDDTNTKCLFLHCLLRANHSDTEWRGHKIKRGQFLTSVDTLTRETGLSVSQIRTSLKKLISTNEIASKSQARSTVITVLSYDSHQDDDKQVNKLMTMKSQPNDNEIATDKNVRMKECKNEKKKEVIDFSLLNLSEYELSEMIRIRKKNKGGSLTNRVIKGLAKELDQARVNGFTNDQILTEWETRGWKSFKAEWVTPKQQAKSTHSFDNQNYQSGKF